MGIVSIDNLNNIESRNESINYDRNRDSLESTGVEFHHESYLFPEGSNDFIKFYAGSPNNSFCNWTQVVSNSGVYYSDKFVGKEGHISGLMIEDVEAEDVRYVVEFGYGIAHTIISRHRFMSGATKKLSAIQQIRVRSSDIPANSTLYYRMKCENDSSWCEASFRYHYHD